MRILEVLRSPVEAGALAGTVSTVVFTLIHDLTISDIWFALPSMVVAGALSGASLAWTFVRLFPDPTLRNWVTLNLIFDTMFVLLGLLSVLLLEPVTTMAAVLAANDFPRELMVQALPMTIIFGLGTAVFLSVLYGRNWIDYASIVITTTILIAVLGLNVSPIGLVDIPSSGFVLVAEMFGLIFALNGVYAVVFWLVSDRRRGRSMEHR